MDGTHEAPPDGGNQVLPSTSGRAGMNAIVAPWRPITIRTIPVGMRNPPPAAGWSQGGFHEERNPVALARGGARVGASGVGPIGHRLQGDRWIDRVRQR